MRLKSTCKPRKSLGLFASFFLPFCFAVIIPVIHIEFTRQHWQITYYGNRLWVAWGRKKNMMTELADFRSFYWGCFGGSRTTRYITSLKREAVYFKHGSKCTSQTFLKRNRARFLCVMKESLYSTYMLQCCNFHKTFFIKGELQPEIPLLHTKLLTLIKAKSNVLL